jgi:hypothetical protein
MKRDFTEVLIIGIIIGEGTSFGEEGGGRIC